MLYDHIVDQWFPVNYEIIRIHSLYWLIDWVYVMSYLHWILARPQAQIKAKVKLLIPSFFGEKAEFWDRELAWGTLAQRAQRKPFELQILWNSFSNVREINLLRKEHVVIICCETQVDHAAVCNTHHPQHHKHSQALLLWGMQHLHLKPP